MTEGSVNAEDLNDGAYRNFNWGFVFVTADMKEWSSAMKELQSKGTTTTTEHTRPCACKFLGHDSI